MYLLRVRLASFMAGFAVAAGLGTYFVQRDLHASHRFLSTQVEGMFSNLEARISHLEKVTENVHLDSSVEVIAETEQGS